MSVWRPALRACREFHSRDRFAPKPDYSGLFTYIGGLVFN